MRNRNKRGISPLIATVLLIGFTIVLAALVMKWGGTLFRETTTQTGCESEGRITCSSRVTVTLGDLNYYTTSGAMNVTVNNQNEQGFKAFNVQFEQIDGVVKNKKVIVPLVAWNSTKLDFMHDKNLTAIKAFYVTPIFDEVTNDGSSCEIVCSEQKQTKLISDTGVYILP